MKGLLTFWCFIEQRASIEALLYGSPSKWALIGLQKFIQIAVAGLLELKKPF